jgi:hypothetical protein
VYLPIRHVCSIVAVGSKADECSQPAPKGRFRLSVLQLPAIACNRAYRVGSEPAFLPDDACEELEGQPVRRRCSFDHLADGGWIGCWRYTLATRPLLVSAGIEGVPVDGPPGSIGRSGSACCAFAIPANASKHSKTEVRLPRRRAAAPPSRVMNSRRFNRFELHSVCLARSQLVMRLMDFGIRNKTCHSML